MTDALNPEVLANLPAPETVQVPPMMKPEPTLTAAQDPVPTVLNTPPIPAVELGPIPPNPVNLPVDPTHSLGVEVEGPVSSTSIIPEVAVDSHSHASILSGLFSDLEGFREMAKTEVEGVLAKWKAELAKIL